MGQIERILSNWFVKHHGEGEPHQAQVYRCLQCGRLMTWTKIRKADICCTGRMSPTNPKLWEKIQLIVFPWSV